MLRRLHELSLSVPRWGPKLRPGTFQSFCGEGGPQALTLGARGQPDGERRIGIVRGKACAELLERGLPSAFDTRARRRIEAGIEPAGQVPRELGMADLVTGDGRHGTANGGVARSAR